VGNVGGEKNQPGRAAGLRVPARNGRLKGHMLRDQA